MTPIRTLPVLALLLAAVCPGQPQLAGAGKPQPPAKPAPVAKPAPSAWDDAAKARALFYADSVGYGPALATTDKAAAFADMAAQAGGFSFAAGDLATFRNKAFADDGNAQTLFAFAAAQDAGASAHSFAQTMKSSKLDRTYAQAQRALDQHKWEEAITAFRNAGADPARADASLYWIAYAQGKLGHRDEALATLAQLRKDHPDSRWSNDAKALDVELRQASGQNVAPDTGADDDIKLMALNGLMRSDPERALPILQKMLTGSQSPRVKERALFVLSQSDSPKAREISTQLARGASNPDVQRMAIRNLAIHGGADNLKILSEVYASSPDIAVRREVLRSYMISGAKDQIAAAARGEKDPTLRREAIRQLGALGDQKLLGELYASESDAVMRGEILSSLMVSGATTKLIELANNEKDPTARRKAIQLLGVMDREKTGPALLDLYHKESDAKLKKQIIQALFTQGNVKPLIDLARAEKDPDLKRDAVRVLSMMKSKEAADYMLEVLNQP